MKNIQRIILIMLSITVMLPRAAVAEDIDNLWRSLQQVEEKLTYWQREAALTNTKLNDVSTKINALKADGVGLIGQFQLDAYLRESQELSLQLRNTEAQVSLLEATRRELTERTLAQIATAVRDRLAAMDSYQASSNYAEFSRVLQEVVAFDNMKRTLEEGAQQQPVYTQPVTLQVADWDSPGELREKASILRDEQENLGREIANCQVSITDNLSEIREKEEAIRFIRDMQELDNDRIALVDVAAIPHLEQELTALHAEVTLLRDYLGKLNIDLARLQEQSERLTAHANQMERELFD